jgi:hypothetical protein
MSRTGIIPSATKHNVTNTGIEILEYVWIVAPTKVAQPREGPNTTRREGPNDLK